MKRCLHPELETYFRAPSHFSNTVYDPRSLVAKPVHLPSLLNRATQWHLHFLTCPSLHFTVTQNFSALKNKRIKSTHTTMNWRKLLSQCRGLSVPAFGRTHVKEAAWQSGQEFWNQGHLELNPGLINSWTQDWANYWTFQDLSFFKLQTGANRGTYSHECKLHEGRNWSLLFPACLGAWAMPGRDRGAVHGFWMNGEWWLPRRVIVRIRPESARQVSKCLAPGEHHTRVAFYCCYWLG